MKNPLIPMGAITGNPSRQQVEEMLQTYLSQGIRQFLIYPRSGCEIEYMSDRWIELCGDVIEIAARNGMSIWLYDEVNWPSGSCGGKVMEEDPEFCAKGVFVENGKCVLKEFDKYADILNPDAVDCFIRHTHEVYFKHFGKYFGTIILGVFTDEPDISYCGVYGEAKFPYTKNAEVYYKERYGRELFEDMAQLEPPEQFKRDYWELLGELYRTNYIGRLNDWCVSHGVVLTGHTNDEHIIEQGIKSSGDTITALRSFSLPAVDEIFNYTSVEKAQWLCFGCAEAAIRTVKNGGLAELFAIAPTDVAPSRIEQMIWLAAMFKIDHYVMAVAAVDIRGNYEKSRYFNPMNYTSPWFSGYEDLGKSAASAATFAGKDIMTEVYVRYPKNAAIKTFYTEKEGVINERLYEVLKVLVREQYQWQLLDEDEETLGDSIPVIEITDAEEFSVREVVENIKVERSLYVLENGALADELFVRKFTDGSCVILDLKDSSEKRELLIVDGDQKIPIVLLGRGHYIVGESPWDKRDVICDIHPEFSMELSHKNTIRCNLNKKHLEYSFTVVEEIKNVALAVRNYRYGGEIFLDGQRISANQICDAFTKGINELYRFTDPFTLSPGVHTVKVSVAAESEMYLPTCFVCGEFSADDTDTLRKLPRRVSSGDLSRSVLSQYTGRIDFEADIKVPDGECAIEMDGADLYMRLYVNNRYLGARMAGYRWEIPKEYQGQTVRFRMEQYTTIAPMFGRITDAVNKEDFDWNWLKTKDVFPKAGISDMRFIKGSKA